MKCVSNKTNSRFLIFNAFLSLLTTSSVSFIFVRPTPQASLANIGRARSKVKVVLDCLVNGLFGPQSHKMGWGDVLRPKIRFPWN